MFRLASVCRLSDQSPVNPPTSNPFMFRSQILTTMEDVILLPLYDLEFSPKTEREVMIHIYRDCNSLLLIFWFLMYFRCVSELINP